TAAIRDTDQVAVAVLNAERHAVGDRGIPAASQVALGKVNGLGWCRRQRCAECSRCDCDPVRGAEVSLAADPMHLHLESPRKTSCCRPSLSLLVYYRIRGSNTTVMDAAQYSSGPAIGCGRPLGD